MQRFFLTHDDHAPQTGETFGNCHWIDLGSHGDAGENWKLLCLLDDHIRPHDDWIALPPLFDSKTTLAASKVPHELLADLGLTGEETTLEAMGRFGEIYPMMRL